MILAAGVMFAKTQNAKADDNVYMLRYDDNSITISWMLRDKQHMIGYGVYDENQGRYIYRNNNYRAQDDSITLMQLILSNVPKGYASKWSVYGWYRDDDGTEYERFYGTAEVNTTPASISKKNFALDSIYQDGKVEFKVNKPAYATKVQLEVYNAKNKRIAKKTMSNYSGKIKVSNGMAYKYRVRSYYKNKEKGKTYYGKWSSYRYFGNANVRVKSAKRAVKVSIKKGTGFSSYTVYISTKPNSYKKAKTIKVGKKSQYNATIKKYGKKKIKSGTYYYVKVVPKVKFGSKTYKSDMMDYGYVYAY